MKIVQLNIEEYLYQFYQKGAEILGRTPEDLMEQALFMYAGMIAQDLEKEETDEQES